MDQFWYSSASVLWLAQVNVAPAQPGSVQLVQPGFFSQIGTYLPSILGAIALLILGWLVAIVVASVVKSLLNRTSIDNRVSPTG